MGTAEINRKWPNEKHQISADDYAEWEGFPGLPKVTQFDSDRDWSDEVNFRIVLLILGLLLLGCLDVVVITISTIHRCIRWVFRAATRVISSHQDRSGMTGSDSD